MYFDHGTVCRAFGLEWHVSDPVISFPEGGLSREDDLAGVAAYLEEDPMTGVDVLLPGLKQGLDILKWQASATIECGGTSSLWNVLRLT